MSECISWVENKAVCYTYLKFYELTILCKCNYYQQSDCFQQHPWVDMGMQLEVTLQPLQLLIYSDTMGFLGLLLQKSVGTRVTQTVVACQQAERAYEFCC